MTGGYIKINEQPLAVMARCRVCVYAAITHSVHGKLSRKSHVQFSRNGVGRGYLVAVTGIYVAVTGSTWQLRGLRGSYGVYM